MLRAPQVEEAQLWYLESLIFRVMEHYNDLAEVMALQHFIPIIDAFHGTARQSVSKRLLLIVASTASQIRCGHLHPLPNRPQVWAPPQLFCRTKA